MTRWTDDTYGGLRVRWSSGGLTDSDVLSEDPLPYHVRAHALKVHTIFPKVTLTSLATSCENMATNSERIKETTRKFQIVNVGRTNLCKHCTTGHYENGDSPATTLSHCRAVASA